MRASLAVIVRRVEYDFTEVLCVTNRRFGCFSLPGGRVEEKETAFEALMREIREELGARAVGATFLGEPAGADCPCSIFHIREMGAPRAVEEGTQLRWMTIDELVAQSKIPAAGAFYHGLFPGGIGHLRETRFRVTTPFDPEPWR